MKKSYLLLIMLTLGNTFVHAMDIDASEQISFKTYNRRNDFDTAADNRNAKDLLRQEVLSFDKELVSLEVDDFEIIVWSADCASFFFRNYQHMDYSAQHVMLHIKDNSATFELITIAKKGYPSSGISIDRDEAVSSILSFLCPVK